jgi:SanA protein
LGACHAKVNTLKRKWNLFGVGILLFCVIVFAPYLWVKSAFAKEIHFQISTLPSAKYGIVFGATVFPDQSLSPVTQERADAAVLLYQNAIIQEIFVSADNRHNLEAEVIASYLEEYGIPQEAITIDRIGIDTGDTCRHFAELHSDGILLTQEFHLPRAMFLCSHDGTSITGLAVNRLNLLKSRGNNTLAIYATRLERNLREAIIMWATILGIYGKYSNEAEIIESQ